MTRPWKRSPKKPAFKLFQVFQGTVPWGLSLLFLILFAAAFSFPCRAEEEPIQMIDGQIEEVKAGESQLAITYFHPVTRRKEKLVFNVDRGTGFDEGMKLEDLRVHEMVSIDYREEGGRARALQVKRVPMKGVPKELKNF